MRLCQHGDVERADGMLLILDRVWQVLTNCWNIASHKLKLRINNILAASFCTRVWLFYLNSVQYGSAEYDSVTFSDTHQSTSACFCNNADILLGTRNHWLQGRLENVERDSELECLMPWCCDLGLLFVLGKHGRSIPDYVISKCNCCFIRPSGTVWIT
jgi:hypothetical protein